MPKFWFIFFLFLLFSSCNEFVLKKSVEIKSLNCNLFFDEINEKIEGNVRYSIENPQDSSINEIFFFCNQNVYVKSIKYKNNNVSFDNAFLYGYNVYRIRIQPLAPLEKQNVELNFTIVGPVEKERFILKKNMVFLDVKEVWLPIPFLSSQKFDYNVRIATFPNKFAIIGGKKVSEIESNEIRYQTYDSEIDNAIESGTLIILEKSMFKKENIFFYTSNRLLSSLVLDYAIEINNFLNKNLKSFSYSQLHIVDNIFQYEDLNLSIEGETFANVILISNFIESGEKEEFYYDYLNNKKLAFYRLLSHEISHSHLSGKLNIVSIDKNFNESIIEYLAILSLKNKSELDYESAILNSRFELFNLILNPQRNDFLLEFVYNYLFLDAIFSNDVSAYFDLIKLLIKKYRFTEIGRNEIFLTIKELPIELKIRLNVNPIDYISNKKLYNSFLKSEVITLTNKGPRNKINLTKVLNLKIIDDYPFEVFANLIINYKTHSITNQIVLNNRETDFQLKDMPVSIILSSPFDYLEENIYDNYLYFENNIIKFIENNLNLFYSGEKKFSNFYIMENIDSSLSTERTFYSDRELSYKLKGRIRIVPDIVKQKDNYIYIMAYKMLNEKPFSYIIIKGKLEKNNIILYSVIDPLL